MTSFYTLIYLVLACLIISSLRFFIILFAFVGHESDQASATKRSKKEAKFQGGGHATACRQYDDLVVAVLQD